MVCPSCAICARNAVYVRNVSAHVIHYQSQCTDALLGQVAHSLKIALSKQFANLTRFAFFTLQFVFQVKGRTNLLCSDTFSSGDIYHHPKII